MDNNQDQVFPLVILGKLTPHVAYLVFNKLDQATLTQCRVVCKVWKNWVDHSTNYWGSVSSANYCKAAEEGRIDICSLIIQKSEIKNPVAIDYRTKYDHHFRDAQLRRELRTSKWTPLHIAAMNGQLEVCRLILANIENNIEEIPSGGPMWVQHPNARYGDQPRPIDVNPLHLAAMEGHSKVCQLFLDTFEPTAAISETLKFDIDTVPYFIQGWAGQQPLHWAAYGGHIEVVRLIIDYLKDQMPPDTKTYHFLNPADDDGITPLHMAAHNEHVEVCRLIMVSIGKNEDHDHMQPMDEAGMTPLDYAMRNKPREKSEREKLAEMFGTMQL